MDGRPYSISPQSVPSTGLTVVAAPSWPPKIDIVFIHGLTGHPVWTWANKQDEAASVHGEDGQPSKSTTKSRKWKIFTRSSRDPSASSGASKSGYWPLEQVPSTAPNARVLTYGYDTRVRHVLQSPGSQESVYQISGNFLIALERERRTDPTRPIIFIAHSLGGIVVKEMLRRSRSCQLGQAYLRGIFESTVGMIFFGTPHGGADPRGLVQRIAEMVIKATGFTLNKQVISALLPNAERLLELSDEFGPMAQERGWVIHSFQEQLGVKALGNEKVVEDASSCIGLPSLETKEHICRNHMEMCRFEGSSDTEYKKFAAALLRIMGSAQTLDDSPEGSSTRGKTDGLEGCSAVRNDPLPSPRPSSALQSFIPAQSNLHQVHIDALMSSLAFERIDAREWNIQPAYASTCAWLLERQEYIEWLDVSRIRDHHGFLWIKGKPGVGKSTLMKFALANAQARAQKDQTVVLSFFFNARGEQLEKSTIGMYRSLLLQLVTNVPRPQNVFSVLRLSKFTILKTYNWSIESLKSVFEQAVLELGSQRLLCLIDALDECDEWEIRNMISHFEHLGQLAYSARVDFRICFSSRHYPHITIKKGLSLVLESAAEHDRDIEDYINGELRIGSGTTAAQIRSQIRSKSSGIFLWVVIVVRLLNKEFDSGRIHKLRERLERIPTGLPELFREIMLRDLNNPEEMLLCVQWLLFARRALTPEELYFAILSTDGDNLVLKEQHKQVDLGTVSKFILNSSKGLAEVTRGRPKRVQFIHESVRDFFLKENGVAIIWPHLENTFAAHAHDTLKTGCLNYLERAELSTLKGPLQIGSCHRPDPFIIYATDNVLYHANAAAAYDVNQKDFLRDFPLVKVKWVEIRNRGVWDYTKLYRPDVSLLYIFAEYNLTDLIAKYQSPLECWALENERYGCPLIAALASGSHETIRLFVQSHIDNASSTSHLSKVCEMNEYPHGYSHVTPSNNYKYNKSESLVSNVVRTRNVVLLACLLETDLCGTDTADDNGRTPLSWAAVDSDNSVFDYLLTRSDVDPDSLDLQGRTPLSWAVESYNFAAVKKLLDNEAVNPSLKDKDGRSPLWWASRSKIDHGSIMTKQKYLLRLLLARDRAQAHHKDKFGMTPLAIAARHGSKGAISVLLHLEDVDPNSQDVDGRTPLHHAISKRDLRSVRWLLASHRTDPNVQDLAGRTPLSWAVSKSTVGIMKELLHHPDIRPDLQDKMSRSPLWWAIQGSLRVLVELLVKDLRVEASLGFMRDDEGNTAQEHAEKRLREMKIEERVASDYFIDLHQEIYDLLDGYRN